MGDLSPTPFEVLEARPEVLCFSLRLGLNTQRCYSMRHYHDNIPPMHPTGHATTWLWRGATGDYGYPSSLDAHVFRSSDIKTALAGETYHNPNTLEDALVRGLRDSDRPLMASWFHSVLCGLPLNRVTQTHQSNRMGEEHYADPKLLNLAYLKGERLSLDTVEAGRVNGAHQELPLKWREKALA